jgi:hypothetical protein
MPLPGRRPGSETSAGQLLREDSAPRARQAPQLGASIVAQGVVRRRGQRVGAVLDLPALGVTPLGETELVACFDPAAFS